MSSKVKLREHVYIDGIRWKIHRPNNRERTEWVLQRGDYNPRAQNKRSGFKPLQRILSTEEIIRRNAESKADTAIFEIDTHFSSHALSDGGKRRNQKDPQ